MEIYYMMTVKELKETHSQLTAKLDQLRRSL